MTYHSDLQVAFHAPGDVMALIAGATRTEDIHFSPGRKWLALAGFQSNRVVVLEVHYTAGDAPSLTCNRAIDVRCDDFKLPHGVCFLDDDLLAVANRAGGLAVVDLRDVAGRTGEVKLEPVAMVPGGKDLAVHTPGSLDVIAVDGGFDLIVCNNYAGRVTRHRLLTGPGRIAFSRHEVLLANQFEVPDGTGISPDGRLLAISNHHQQEVDIYDLAGISDPVTPPVCRLLHTGYPHGIRFAQGGRYFLVADAGAPVIHVYERGEDGWAGDMSKAGALQVLTTQQFMAGRADPAEGGPKGICVADDLDLLAVTCEMGQLSFYRLGAFIERALCPEQFARLTAVLDSYRAMPMFATQGAGGKYPSRTGRDAV